MALRASCKSRTAGSVEPFCKLGSAIARLRKARLSGDVLISAYPNNMPLTNRLPSDRTNNPIHCDRWNVERQSMLETSDRAIRLRSKDSIHREPFTRFARTELE